MNRRIITATAWRIICQLRHDRRTLAMMFLVPPALIALLKYIFNNTPGTFDRIGVPLVGIFPLTIMFLVTSIAMLRERTTGTLERLMSMPLAKLDLLLGYGLAFAVFAAIQATITATVAFALLRLNTQGPIWLVVALAILNALLGMALGLLVSAFAQSEFQAVQFMPAIIIPQLLLSGLFVPRNLMPRVLDAISGALPFTYAFDARKPVAHNDLDSHLWIDIAVITGCVHLALALGAATLRRRTR